MKTFSVIALLLGLLFPTYFIVKHVSLILLRRKAADFIESALKNNPVARDITNDVFSDPVLAEKAGGRFFGVFDGSDTYRGKVYALGETSALIQASYFYKQWGGITVKGIE